MIGCASKGIGKHKGGADSLPSAAILASDCCTVLSDDNTESERRSDALAVREAVFRDMGVSKRAD